MLPFFTYLQGFTGQRHFSKNIPDIPTPSLPLVLIMCMETPNQFDKDTQITHHNHMETCYKNRQPDQMKTFLLQRIIQYVPYVWTGHSVIQLCISCLSLAPSFTSNSVHCQLVRKTILYSTFFGNYRILHIKCTLAVIIICLNCESLKALYKVSTYVPALSVSYCILRVHLQLQHTQLQQPLRIKSINFWLNRKPQSMAVQETHMAFIYRLIFWWQLHNNGNPTIAWPTDPCIMNRLTMNCQF